MLAKLSVIAEVKTNLPTADFWLTRRGSPATVGTAVRTYAPEHIGIKIKEQAKQIIDPKFLYYYFLHLQGQGYFQKLATGTINLVNITVRDVANIQLNFR